MPYRTTTYTASKKTKPNEPWYVVCTIHGEFENDIGRCLLCDDETANLAVEDQWNGS